MRLLTPSLALLLLLLPMDDLWIEPVQASFFSSSSSAILGNSNGPSCGDSYSPCPATAPCCHNGTCHRTSFEYCSIALGCEPEFSHALKDTSSPKKKKKKSLGDDYEPVNPQSCFPLPVCRSFTEKFKSNEADKKGQHQVLLPKRNFSGDPDQVHWTSDFDHIASYAQVDTKQKRLVLKAKRDIVKTQSGGGFGATVSSTRWNRYGTFAAKLKSGATGPGIVTAMMLSNPVLGDEITIEVTGRDPKTVVTDLYRHSAQDSRGKSGSYTAWLPSFNSVVPSLDGLRIRTRKLKDMILPSKTAKKKALTTDVVVIQHSNAEGEDEEVEEEEDESLEESHVMKKSATDTYMVYKIEWTPEHIRWSVDNNVIRTLKSKDLLASHGYGIPSHPMQLQLTIWDGGHNVETAAWAGGRTEYGDNDEREYATLVEWIEIACQDRKEYKNTPWPGKDASKRLELVAKEEKAEREAQAKEEKKRQVAEDKKRKEEEKRKKKETKKAAKEEKAAAKKNRGGWIFGRGKKQQEEEQDKDEGKGKWFFSRRSTDDRKSKSSWWASSSEKSSEPGRLARFLDSLIQTLFRSTLILVALVGSAVYLTEPHDAEAETRRKHQLLQQKLQQQQQRQHDEEQDENQGVQEVQEQLFFNTQNVPGNGQKQ